MIRQIDKPTIRTINTDIINAIQSVAEKHRVVIQFGNTSYTSKNYTSKLNVSIVEGGTVITKEAESYNRYSFGLTNELNSYFKDWNGNTWKIIGAKPRSSKYPIIVENERGTKYKMSVEQIKRGTVVSSF
jgi:hypothetical protein